MSKTNSLETKDSPPSYDQSVKARYCWIYMPDGPFSQFDGNIEIVSPYGGSLEDVRKYKKKEYTNQTHSIMSETNGRRAFYGSAFW